VVIALGFIFLSQKPVNGFMSLTLAPILLVLGFCVIFPYAIMAKEKGPQQEAAAGPKGD
jgi:hypothetical protein